MSLCPVCSAQSPGRSLGRACLVSSADHQLLECPECGLVRFDPPPSDGELKQFYAASYFNFPRYREEGYGRAFARKLVRIAPRGRLLDVGCATGFFINGVRKASGWEVSGVEFGASAAGYAREKLGLEVRCGSLEDAGFPEGYFDYIRINNVLEHVRDPRSLLLECRRIIAPGGRLALAVPNGPNDCREIIDFFRDEGAAPRSKNGHISFFAVKTLQILFNLAGFRVVSAHTGSLKRGLRNCGLLPRKRDWKRDYYPASASGEPGRELRIPDGRRYPEAYYRWRQFQGDIFRVPGLHEWGLDFLLLLRPAGEQ